MIKVWIHEFDCYGESRPYGGFAFEVADEAELQKAIADLESEYAGGVRKVIPRFDVSENERFYNAYDFAESY